MMIGALGAIDDITVTQASAIWELREVDPTRSRGGCSSVPACASAERTWRRP